MIRAVILTAAAIASVSAPKHHVYCHSNKACIVHVAHDACEADSKDTHHCTIWKHWEWAHNPALDTTTGGTLYTTFALCVANREAGSPGAVTYSTVDWGINTGNGYTGGYQFADETWKNVEKMMGVSWTDEAWKATPAEQTQAFDFYEPKDPYAWPLTVPACGGP